MSEPDRLVIITPELMAELQDLAGQIYHTGSPTLIRQWNKVALLFDALSDVREDGGITTTHNGEPLHG